MKTAPEFVKSPYWDVHTDKAKPGTPPDIKAALEKEYKEYLAEKQSRLKAWDEASQALIDANKK
jgi:hypothetical protein